MTLSSASSGSAPWVARWPPTFSRPDTRSWCTTCTGNRRAIICRRGPQGGIRRPRWPRGAAWSSPPCPSPRVSGPSSSAPTALSKGSKRGRRVCVYRQKANMSGYAITCALAETFTMGVKAGMDPVALWEAVRQGVVGRRLTFDGLLDQFLPGKYDPPNFALKLATKDVKLATELGRELGVPMRMCNLAYAEMREACNRGWEGRDSRAVMLLEQERAGVKIEADPERVKQAAERAKSG